MRRTRFAVAVVVLAAVVAGMVAQDKPEPPLRKYTFGTMGVAMRDDLTIYQGGGKDAEDKVVVGPGDRLLKFAGKDLKTLDDFCRALYATKPGEEVEVSFERTNPDTKEKQTLTAKITLGDPKSAYASLYTHKEKRQRSFDWSKAAKAAGTRDRAWKEVVDAKLEGAWDSVLAAHERELDLWDCFESTTACEALLKDPLCAEAFIREITDALAKPTDTPQAVMDAVAPALLRLADRDPASCKPWKDGEGLEAIRRTLYPLDWTRSGTDATVQHLNVDPGRVASFEVGWAGTPAFARSVGIAKEIRKLGGDWGQILPRVSAALATANEGLKKEFDAVQWPDENFPAAIPTVTGGNGTAPNSETPRGKGPNEDGACKRWFTYHGIVAVGGYGKNVWRSTDTERYALIVDLGGDDEYIDCASTHFAPSADKDGKGRNRVSVVIDLGGNDRYRATGKWGVGAGVMGTAIIYDALGDDTYECPEWGIGAAFGGIGVVIDARGNDRYMGGRNTIGCAAYGFGGVIDLSGNDVYDSHEYSIGVGHPGGVGFVLDRAGDDRYRCTGKTPSGYGTKGEYSGWGIGCGFGWRTLAAGGTGLVVDCAGNDIYDAGEFGLGCGYFLGVGLVRDMGGDDIYHSSRYGLATAAHCAVGLFMDDSGNDVYVGKTAASMAGVWDIAVGYFHEGGGNDVYRCDGLGLGASAQNGVGIFWEAGGDDVYQCGDSCLGYGGAAEYAGGRLARNFGLFFDLGGNDTYPGAPKNKSKTWAREYGLFVDE